MSINLFKPYNNLKKVGIFIILILQVRKPMPCEFMLLIKSQNQKRAELGLKCNRLGPKLLNIVSCSPFLLIWGLGQVLQ